MKQSVNHTFFNDDAVKRELNELERYYTENFRLFCQAIDITPAQLREAEPLKLLTVMLMRVYGQLTSRIDTLERSMKNEHRKST